MTKHIEIKPMVIPVINHAYGVDSEFDITEKATTMFEEISYEIYRCSHGIVKYEQDSFVRVNEMPNLEDTDLVLVVPKGTVMARYKPLIHYLDWNRGVSVYDRFCNGFNGEFWLYGLWFDDYCNINIRGRGYIPSMGMPYDRKIADILETFIWRLHHRMSTNDWQYDGSDPRKWLSRLPEKYWGNIK
jgi:hypothetical protein